MMQSTCAIILFARAPRLGKVKTRLQSHLDQETVLQLYSCFLRDSIEKICAIEEADSFIGVAEEEDLDYFLETVTGKGIYTFSQSGDNLGERMRNAFLGRFKEGYKRIVIIGSDSPSLPVRCITQAFEANRDLIIGPSFDGGYYLIGMRNKVIEVFDGVEWGSEKVLEQTLFNVATLQVSLESLPLWYDIDRLEDLRFLRSHLSLLCRSGEQIPPATADYLIQLKL
tara:strand:+ start:2191 stop:2868 length:678 start_codon:yes stop_codon:yes gene_type:complete